jgi:MFS family permease
MIQLVVDDCSGCMGLDSIIINKFICWYYCWHSISWYWDRTVYPTLLAAISDITHPKWRANSLGVYRFWRDLGFAFGAIGVGFIADISDNSIAIQLVAWIAGGSGIVVLLIMKETRRGTTFR